MCCVCQRRPARLLWPHRPLACQCPLSMRLSQPEHGVLCCWATREAPYRRISSLNIKQGGQLTDSIKTWDTKEVSTDREERWQGLALGVSRFLRWLTASCLLGITLLLDTHSLEHGQDLSLVSNQQKARQYAHAWRCDHSITMQGPTRQKRGQPLAGFL